MVNNEYAQLSQQEKAELFGIYASHGYTDLAKIIAHYNSCGGHLKAAGGPIPTIPIPDIVQNVVKNGILSLIPNNVAERAADVIHRAGIGSTVSDSSAASNDPGLSFLMSPWGQKEYLENLGYHMVDDNNYGMVSKASDALSSAINGTIPIYQLGDDDIDPSMVDLVSTDPEVISKYIERMPYDRRLKHAGNYPSALYKDKNSDTYYIKSWDLNDYGDHAEGEGTKYPGFKQALANFYDHIGNPFVQRTGLVKLDEEYKGFDEGGDMNNDRTPNWMVKGSDYSMWKPSDIQEIINWGYTNPDEFFGEAGESTRDALSRAGMADSVIGDIYRNMSPELQEKYGDRYKSTSQRQEEFNKGITDYTNYVAPRLALTMAGSIGAIGGASALAPWLADTALPAVASFASTPWGRALKTGFDTWGSIDGIKNALSDNGISKTARLIDEGRYGRALLSGVGDALDVAGGIGFLGDATRYGKGVAKRTAEAVLRMGDVARQAGSSLTLSGRTIPGRVFSAITDVPYIIKNRDYGHLSKQFLNKNTLNYVFNPFAGNEAALKMPWYYKGTQSDFEDHARTVGPDRISEFLGLTQPENMSWVNIEDLPEYQQEYFKSHYPKLKKVRSAFIGEISDPFLSDSANFDGLTNGQSRRVLSHSAAIWGDQGFPILDPGGFYHIYSINDAGEKVHEAYDIYKYNADDFVRKYTGFDTNSSFLRRWLRRGLNFIDNQGSPIIYNWRYASYKDPTPAFKPIDWDIDANLPNVETPIPDFLYKHPVDVDVNGLTYASGGPIKNDAQYKMSSLLYNPPVNIGAPIEAPLKYYPLPHYGDYEYASSNGFSDKFPVNAQFLNNIDLGFVEPEEIEEPEVNLFSEEAKAMRKIKQRYAESKFNDKAKSKVGAQGAWQIMPITYKDYLGRGKGKSGDLNDPKYNEKIRDWVMKMIPRDLQEFWSDDDSDINKLAKLYAAYNWGAGSLRSYLRKRQKAGKNIDDPYEWVEDLNPETKRYVKYLVFNEDFDEKTGYTTKQFEDAARSRGYMAEGGRLFGEGGPENGGFLKRLMGVGTTQPAMPGVATSAMSFNRDIPRIDSTVGDDLSYAGALLSAPQMLAAIPERGAYGIMQSAIENKNIDPTLTTKALGKLAKQLRRKNEIDKMKRMLPTIMAMYRGVPDAVGDTASWILDALDVDYSKGGKIHIKPKNRGKFTALKKRTGHSASWFKAHGTPAQKKMAIFALNARKWKHGDGGSLANYLDYGGPYSVSPLGGDYLSYLQTMLELSGGMIDPSVVTAELPAKFNGSQEAAARYAEGYQKGAKPVSEAMNRAGQDIFRAADTVAGFIPGPIGMVDWLGHMGADAAEGNWGKVGRDAALATALGAGARGISWLKNYVDDATNFGEDIFHAFTDSNLKTYRAPKVQNVPIEYIQPIANSVTNNYQINDLGGGYMLKSLMRGNPLEKQISKNGTVNVNNIRALIGKGSKVEQAVVNKVLASEEFAGKKSIDYNKFRKAVQDELITYERTPDTRWNNYGIDGLRIGSYMDAAESPEMRDRFNEFIMSNFSWDPVSDQYYILEDPSKSFNIDDLAKMFFEDGPGFLDTPVGVAKKLDTFTFSSSRIPNGSAKHYSPNTLGHSRTYTTIDEPDVLHVMESQSDWAQEGRNFNYDFANFPGFNPYDENHMNILRKMQQEPREQMAYLADNYTSRQIQENLRYAAEKGQTKMRYPTRETAAKIEGYEKRNIFIDESGNRLDPLNDRTKIYTRGSSIDKEINDLLEMRRDSKKISELQEIDRKLEELYKIKEYVKPGLTETTQYTTGDINNSAAEAILRKYDAFPKQYQKLYKGADIRIVTDSKGNTWYEVDVPENYLQQEWSYKYGGSLREFANISDIF